jgi:hypothetical protein
MVLLLFLVVLSFVKMGDVNIVFKMVAAVQAVIFTVQVHGKLTVLGKLNRKKRVVL